MKIQRFYILVFALVLTLLLSGCTQNNAETSSNTDTSSKNEISESQTDESEIIDDFSTSWKSEVVFPDGFDDGEEYFIVAPLGGCDPVADSFKVAIQSKLTAPLSSETFPVCVSFCGGSQKEIDEFFPNYTAVLELIVDDQTIPLKEFDLSRFIEDGHDLKIDRKYDEDGNEISVYNYPTGEIFNISTELIQPYNGKSYDHFSIVITLYDGEKQYHTEGTASVYYHREDDEIKFFSYWPELEDYLISIGEMEAE